MRSADLFGQLLRLPASQPAPAPRQEHSPNTAHEPKPTSEDKLAARNESGPTSELAEKPVSNEIETEDETDLSAAANTAAALAVAASEEQAESQSASELAPSESTALNESSAGQSLQALENANVAEGELASKLHGLNVSNTEDEAAAQLLAEQGQLNPEGEATQPNPTPLDLERNADSNAGSDTKANHGLPAARLPGGQNTDTLKEEVEQRFQADAAQRSEQEQAATQSHSSEPTSTQERSAKGDRRQRGKWYEQDFAKIDQTAANLREHVETQSEKLLASEVSTDALADSAADAPPSQSIAPRESNPPLVDSLASSAAVVAAEARSVGAGSTNELPNAATGSASSSTLELGEGLIGSNSSPSAIRRGATETQQPGTVQPGDSTDLTQQEKIRLIQRVTRSFSRLGVDGGQINLRLHPPQLGALNVQVRLEGRSMTAKLTTETGAARDAILESLPILKNRLAEQGFEISQFLVEVANNDQADASLGGNAGEQAFDQDAYRRHQPDTPYSLRQPPRSTQANLDPTRTVGPNAALRWQTSTGIDIQA